MSNSVDAKVVYIRSHVNLLTLQDKKSTLNTIYNYNSKLIKETTRGCSVNFEKITDENFIDNIYQQIKFKIERNI